MGRRGRQPRTTPPSVFPQTLRMGREVGASHPSATPSPGLLQAGTPLGIHLGGWGRRGGALGRVPLEASPDPVAAWESMI